MSRAFVREDDSAGGDPLPERPISPHQNLVTRRGLTLIQAQLVSAQQRLKVANDAEDEEAVARAMRDQRYWAARLASAELSEPPEPSARVVFGTAVTLARADGSECVFRIVGEDEADPAEGRIAWPAPVARSLLGAEVGDTRRLPTGEVEVLAIDPAPEAS